MIPVDNNLSTFDDVTNEVIVTAKLINQMLPSKIESERIKKFTDFLMFQDKKLESLVTNGEVFFTKTVKFWCQNFSSYFF